MINSKIMNKELNLKVQHVEQSIKSTKSALKSWANQIGKHHTQLKVLSQELEAIKKEINKNMNENNNKLNQQGGTK